MQKLEGANDQLEAFQTTLDQLEDSKVSLTLKRKIIVVKRTLDRNPVEDGNIVAQTKV